VNATQRQRLLGLVTGAAFALFVGDRFVFSPLTRAWNDRSHRIAELRKRVTQGAMLVEREAAIRQRWTEMRTNMLSTDVSIAEGQVLRAFDQWSRESGVSISSIRPQWKQSADDHRTLECRADAFGSLANLTRFLFLIEKDPLGVKVDNLELSVRDNQGEQLNLVLQLSGLMLQPPGS
jgi:hypothetical protein